MSEPETPLEPVAFDMGVSTLSRINYWLWKCNESQFADDLNSWVKSVKMVYKETETFMKDKDKTSHKSKLKEINKEYNNFISIYNAHQTITKGKQPFRVSGKIFELLLEWEIELRNILDKEGLLMKKGEDARSAIM